jgi:hypothetical protein
MLRRTKIIVDDKLVVLHIVNPDMSRCSDNLACLDEAPQMLNEHRAGLDGSQ